ncbi:MAG TPA: rhamnulokinase family protein [Blastocatellia bacterium]|nr:rhamnulokinase family protein [Blastocatellia bacterium]
MRDSLYIAVDLGAGSGRVFLVGVSPGELLLEEVRRFHYPPGHRDGHLRWDLPHIFAEIKAGLHVAGARAREFGRPVQSIGVDSWGVDYGLIDGDGRLLEDPICYRDERTTGEIEKVCSRISRADLFDRTGIQLLNFNTIFQLSAHAREGIPGNAARLLLIPDLINFMLTGRAVTEYTNATTTQLVNARTGAWDRDIIERLNLPARLFAEIIQAGTDLGPLRPGLAAETGLEGVHVIATATHDTGSAVAGAPLADGWAYISSGTWSLVGVEPDGALVNAEVARHNFTNEGGAFGTTRFLKNVMGLWILESCRREWKESGLEIEYDKLLGQVAALADKSPPQELIFPDDPRFLNPPSMVGAIAEQLNELGRRPPVDPPALAKVILDSLAFRYRSVLRAIERLTGRKIQGVQIVGGGCLNDYLNQVTASVTGLPVLAGPAEATVVGNVLVQAVAQGRFESLAEARRHVMSHMRPKKFTPLQSSGSEEAERRYAAIEARFVEED